MREPLDMSIHRINKLLARKIILYDESSWSMDKITGTPSGRSPRGKMPMRKWLLEEGWRRCYRHLETDSEILAPRGFPLRSRGVAQPNTYMNYKP